MGGLKGCMAAMSDVSVVVQGRCWGELFVRVEDAGTLR